MTHAEPDDKPGFVDRFRARYRWFDHAMRAQERYKDSKGDFYAAGITYFTIFALFPLLMVGFAIAGFILASQPELLAEIQDRIRASVSGDSGTQLVELMDSAIESRTSVGVIGLLAAVWAGLGWMANLREALSQMWGLTRGEPKGFLRTKLSDLTAIAGLFLAIALTVALTVVSSSGLARKAVEWVGLQDVPGMSVLLRVVSLLVSVLISWLLFTWIISRLPRESVSFRSALRAGLLAAVAFEIFKQVASIYLQSVVTGPAGATFGPVLGLMVFAYITSRLILFATAWAATSTENLEAAPVEPPGLARIAPRVQVHEGVGAGGVLTAAAVGALGALGISRWTRDR
ncbi:MULTISPECIES: inner membrane protein YhjD [unclassified Mycobacterium]|uniref:inner membrane protein YhjD n=1 Tax=unclassified Mycobacterium TaxID=2642494 RepID=UPI00073FE71D|nr:MULTISPECIES: inner membrane protein YhjD [unclassified Mycobacterium]KUH88135.1 inner membrane protein YhjD [Mycobacterium sp. GA-1999]KUH89443.1 inner membrane protein YhjD [Mycobacterium sp. GA-0227b]